MATYNKFQNFVTYLHGAELDLEGSPPPDTLTLMLVLAPAPVATNSVKTDLTEITAGNGYTAGGEDLTNPTGTEATGTFTLAADEVTWTASGGAINDFRYPVLYDNTHASDVLIAWWDHGSTVSLNDGDSFTVKFNNQASGGTIYTLS